MSIFHHIFVSDIMIALNALFSKTADAAKVVWADTALNMDVLAYLGSTNNSINASQRAFLEARKNVRKAKFQPFHFTSFE
jgi:hypothetical protein